LTNGCWRCSSTSRTTCTTGGWQRTCALRHSRRGLADAIRFDPARGLAVDWFYGIGQWLLDDAGRRCAARDRARRRLGLAALEPGDGFVEGVTDGVRGPWVRIVTPLHGGPSARSMATSHGSVLGLEPHTTCYAK
jgi:hypothetical protein